MAHSKDSQDSKNSKLSQSGVEAEQNSHNMTMLTTIYKSIYKLLEVTGDYTKASLFFLGSLIRRGGSFLLRRFRILGRRSLRLFKRAACAVGRRFAVPFILAANGVRLMKSRAGQAKAEGTSVFKAVSGTFFHGVYNNRRYFKTAVNYAMPVLCIGVLAYIIHFASMLTFAVEVNYNGETLGYVSDESVYEQAEHMMQQRIIYEDGNDILETNPQFSLSVVDKDQLINEDNLTDQLIKNSNQEITEAEGLYIDGEFYGAVKDAGVLEEQLDSMLQVYRDKEPDAEVSFVKDVEIKQGLYLTASVVDTKELTDLITGEVQTEKTYTVVEGDTPTGVASKNDVAYSELKALNPDIETNFLPGRELVLQASEPFLSVKVSKVMTYNETVSYETEEIEDDNYVKGYSVLKQEGQDGENQITAKVEYVNGTEVSRDILETVVLKEPVTKQIIKGTREPASNDSVSRGKGESITAAAGTQFMWPVGGGYTSSGYGGSRRHKGTDIAAPKGTPVYASASGTVTLAKWYSGYGKCVIIDHGNGYQTLYGHNSELYVQVGQYVEQGENIAAVGMTGQATGNHCHFEVRYNGSILNPENFIGRRGR